MSKLFKKEIGFLDSYSADTAVVPAVISKLINDLRTIGYPQDEIDEIVLSMDESITNAIQETLKKNYYQNIHKTNPKRNITVRYTVSSTQFDATIIDHGTGLDIFNIKNNTPDSRSDDYINQIMRYASEAEQNKINIRINGEQVHLKGIGAGLKIILNFMDQVTIDLIDKEKVISSSVTEHTDGTIFNMHRKRRY